MCPKVSVIIPVYNSEKYIEQCIDSVISQTLSEIEIICIDDGSSDNSLHILEQYAQKDSRIIIEKQKNAGAGSARNLGLKLAQGEYLSFFDADDFFDRSLLENVYKQCVSDSADICIYKTYRFDDETRTCSIDAWRLREDRLPSMIPFNYNDMPNYIFNTFQHCPWDKMFRRQFILDNNLKFQELKRTNDLFFTASALVSAEYITVLLEHLVYYRVGTKSNSQATNHIAPYDFYKALLALRDLLFQRGIYKQVEQSFINMALSVSLYNLFSHKSREAFQLLYNKLHSEIITELSFDQYAKNYYYDNIKYKAFQYIKDHTYLQYINDLNPEKPVAPMKTLSYKSRLMYVCAQIIRWMDLLYNHIRKFGFIKTCRKIIHRCIKKRV